MKIRLVVTGRSYHLTSPLPDALELAPNSSVDDALREVDRLLGDRFSLPSSCLVAVSGNHAGTVERHDNPTLREGDELALILPVAGG